MLNSDGLGDDDRRDTDAEREQEGDAAAARILCVFCKTRGAKRAYARVSSDGVDPARPRRIRIIPIWRRDDRTIIETAGEVPWMPRPMKKLRRSARSRAGAAHPTATGGRTSSTCRCFINMG